MSQAGGPYIRPGFLISRIGNPVMRRLGFVHVLVVRGRQTGHRLEVPMGKPLEYGGAQYLVSGRGQTHWVRNLRAAGRAEFRYHGRSEPFRAVEVLGAEQERIVGAYREQLGRSVDRYFERIPDPADHPVFRMESMAGDGGSADQTA